MTDHPQTPEAVAYALMRDIAVAEGVRLSPGDPATIPADREWILTTYAECLNAAKAELPKAAPSHGRSSF